MRYFPAVFAGAALTLSGAAAAQTDDDAAEICYAGLVADLLLGSYSVETSPMKMTAAGRTLYLGNWETNSAQIVHSDLLEYMLDFGTPELGQVRLLEEDALEPEWYWSADPQLTGSSSPEAGIGSEDIEIMLGCRIQDLPRLSATFTSQSQDSSTLNHTLRLMLLGDGWLFGQWHWSARPPEGPVEAVRSINMERTSGP